MRVEWALGGEQFQRGCLIREKPCWCSIGRNPTHNTNEDLQVVPTKHRDLKTYVPPSTKGLTVAKIGHHDKVQVMTQPALVKFFNPCHGECPHVILCHYFGDEFMEVAHCCEHCDPRSLETHLVVVKDYMAVMARRKPKKSKQVGHLPGENFHKAPKDLCDYVRGKLLSWREDVWRK